MQLIEHATTCGSRIASFPFHRQHTHTSLPMMCHRAYLLNVTGSYLRSWKYTILFPLLLQTDAGRFGGLPMALSPTCNPTRLSQAPVILDTVSRFQRGECRDARSLVPAMCTALVELLRAELEIHWQTAELTSPDAMEVLPLLACVEGLMQV